MTTYLYRVKELIFEFNDFSIRHFLRKENTQANLPANLSSTIGLEFGRTILIKIITKLSIYTLKEIITYIISRNHLGWN